MKKHLKVISSLSLVVVLAACSSKSVKTDNTEFAKTDQEVLDLILTERALAQTGALVKNAGGLLPKLLGGLATQAEKNAAVQLIEQAAKESGIALPYRLNASNVASAISRKDAPTILLKMQELNPSLFKGKESLIASAQKQKAAFETEAKMTQQQSDELAAELNLENGNTIADIQNLSKGFGSEGEAYVAQYVAVQRRVPGFRIYNKGTCGTVKKLDKQAGQNLLAMGEAQVKASNMVKRLNLTGAKAIACMNKLGAAAVGNYAAKVLGVPTSGGEIMPWMQAASGSPCYLAPETYPAAMSELLLSNNGRLPAVEEVTCAN